MTSLLSLKNAPSKALVPGRYGAIDIGTVTCRLLVADIDEDGRLHEVLRSMAICNLGEGVDETHRLKPEAIERVGQAVDGFMAEIHSLDPPLQKLVAMATSASRDAQNADVFRDRLARSGVELRIIPGEQEASLSFAGASSAFPDQSVVVVDVGGGSTEVIAGQGGSAPRFARSFDVGCRRLTERFLSQDPPSEEELASAARWIDETMEPYLKELRSAGCFQGRILAVAGTATSAVSIREAMADYDPELIHGESVSRSDLDDLLQRLAALPCDQRAKVVGLEPKRAPVIVAGLLILQRILALTDSESFTVSEWDILHGIILDAAS